MLMRMGNLASAYSGQGLWKQVEELQAQVMMAHLRLFGDEHRKTLTIMRNIASIYRNLGGLNIQTHCSTLRTLHRHTGKRDRDGGAGSPSEGYSSQAVRVQTSRYTVVEVQVMEAHLKLFGAEHPDILKSMGSLMMTYRNL